LAILVPDFEGSLVPALGLHLVEANAADAGDAARFLNVRPERGVVGERFEVAFNHLRASRILVGRRRIPARRRQQPRRRLVDVVFPGREQLDVAPLAHGVPNIVAGFQHDRLKAALQHMGGGGEADRPGSDDRDGFGSAHVILR
jgi:hypothetical protein